MRKIIKVLSLLCIFMIFAQTAYSYASPVSINSTAALSSSTLDLQTTINIILIVIGVLLILLGIAILIRMRN